MTTLEQKKAAASIAGTLAWNALVNRGLEGIAAHVGVLRAYIEALEEENSALLELLEDATRQACGSGDEVDSMALSAYADSLRALSERGRFEIQHERYRRVIGRWKEHP